MAYVIGIDGGGTQTTGVMANEQGEIFANVTVGATNPNSVEKEQLKQTLRKLFQQIQMANPYIFNQVSHVFAGLSGADHPQIGQNMHHMLTTIVPEHMQVTIDNDAITALYSGTLGEPGIVQIAGTGSITFGVNASAKRKRAGGWGYLFSDHGSGYSVGRDALEAVFFAYDGMQDETVLTDKICHKFDIHHLPDIIQMVYQTGRSREVIASLCELVMEAGDEGDEIALEVIRNNGKQLGRSIAHLHHKLFHDDETNSVHPVILVGGLFYRYDLLQDSIKSKLIQKNTKVELIQPTMSPVGGAVIAALQQQSVKITNSFVEQFTSQANLI